MYDSRLPPVTTWVGTGRPLWARRGTAATEHLLPPPSLPVSRSRSCIPLFSSPFTRREPPEREHRRSATRVECPQVLEFKTMARISSRRITWICKYPENSGKGVFFVWKKQVLVEPAEIFRLHSPPPSSLWWVYRCVCVFFSSPRLLRSRRPWVWRLQPNPSRETRNEEDTALISSCLAVHWCVCAIGVFNVRPGVTTSRTNPRQTEKLRIFWAPNEALAS